MNEEGEILENHSDANVENEQYIVNTQANVTNILQESNDDL